MTSSELKVLLEACKAAGIPPHEVRPDNPFSHSGTPRAQMLQAAVEQVNPAQAAAWRVEAGGSISLATAAAESGLIDHTAETKADLRRHNPNYVTQEQKAQAEWEAEQMKQLESGWRQRYEARTGQSADDYDTPNFALHGPAASAVKAQWELNRAMGGN